MAITTDTTTITRKLVPEASRADFVDALFGINFPLQFEPFVFVITSELSSDYGGGYWDFYTISNGGFYMAPVDGEQFAVQCENGYQGMISADALGLTACLYAFSRLSFVASECIAQVYARHYYLLRKYAIDHPEAEAIIAATD
jgi:hypothetical protein